ncbi:replication C family protein [Piscinibacter sp. Jin2]|uniref:Replication C family protein n=1 Tax=Aquariibacter lacus TaxID=2801332 RepID=A0A9X0XDS1_9BURK|nr:replication protein C, IncQ-type [Piscinibacter lacus]MBL0719739.1 replication C family protein [Piscinibacter lacus]
MKRKPSGAAAVSPRVVRLAQPFGLCQLFRPMPKDGVARPTLNETVVYAGTTLRFSAREALGVPEQTLLLVLLELAQEQYRRQPAAHHLLESDRSEVGSLLWSGLCVSATESTGQVPSTLMLNCSWSELHRRCGSASVGGAVNQTRRRSLQRLCEVTVWERVAASRQEHSCRLVSWLVGDDQRVHVALNYRLAAAILAPGYAQLFLSERLALRSQTAMLVHAFLSTCLGAGKTLSVGYGTLVDRLWPDTGEVVSPTTRKRRPQDVKAALKGISELQRWSVELGPAVAQVTRRSATSAPQPAQLRPSTGGRHQPPPTPGKPAAREMTSPGRFADPSSSYGGHPFWKRLNADKDLPRNDEVGMTS